MRHIDVLSRAPVENANENVEAGTMFHVQVRENKILIYQRSDKTLLRKIKISEKAERSGTRREKVDNE